MNTVKASECALCGKDVLSTKDTHTDSGIEYVLHECANCSGQFWWPLRNPGSTWYERDERYADRNQNPILDPNDKHLGVLKYFGPGKERRVLDVGCGVGNFLAPMEKAGWESWGIDFDRDAIEAGARAFGLQHLSVHDFQGFANEHPELKFDLVTFFDVLEHLDDHHSFMQVCSNVLVPEGYIALSMPYRHGWRWLMPHDLPPRHLTRWDEASIRTFLSREGFSTQKIVRLPASIYFITLKLKFRYGRWSSFGLVSKARESAASKGTDTSERNVSFRVRCAQMLAKAKDLLLFGLPALVLWTGLLCTRKRYTDFYVIARANSLTPVE